MSRRGESKRFILSVVGRIFDPIGILCPFVIKLKCLLQELWTLGVEWDSELPPKLRHKWQQWSSEAEGLTEIKIPRFYLGNIDQEISKCEIHCFSDASKSAYGTILYLRFVTCNNEIETSFICSKSRVAPLKSLTLPRLELTAALLSARLAKQVSSCLKFDANIYYWTDSLISYYWIRGDSSAFKPYIKNRVQEIQLLSDPMQWGHCPGKDNPADLLSRGTSAVNLAQNELWWHGPPWLKLTPDHWPNRHRDILDSELCSEELEHRSSVHVAVTQQREALVDINRFSSLKKLLKTTAWVFRFVNNARNIYKSMDFYITADEIQNAEYFWLKCVQSEFYSAEILALKQNEQLRSSSEIKNLVPYLDENNLLRLTILSEVEVIVNHRPLTYVENDPGEPKPLTPAHFLELGYGESKYPIHFIELIDATTAKESYKKRKTCRTLLLKQLWRRWKEQYLLQLKTANHFKTPSVHKNLKLNDVVLVEGNVKSKLLWELGIIKEIFIGRDDNKALEINSDFSNFVELADSNFNVPGKIDLLLGVNIFYELLKPERIKIKGSQLLLVNSAFGYIVTGKLDLINETKVHCGLVCDEDLNKTLEKFWKVEEVEEPIVKNKERLICEEHYANTHFRTKEGKYVVSMPLKKEPSCLGNSKDIALKRLGSLWNRSARDEKYLNLYREFLRDYERLGHMKEVTNETEPEITYYATHHGIYGPEKSTTKLRVVFNCSSLTDNGISLNDIQYNGGVIQEDLYAQMLRFRTYTYAFTSDIKMMYRTILINFNQRNLQRIVWCESEHESPKIYELSTVTYGTVSAPYLAQRTSTQLSMDEEANFPIAASVLWNNLYMDDVLYGAVTVAKIQELYPNQLWRHEPSDQNPADLVSRGVDPDKLLQQNLWFNEPTFLSGDDYPNRTINCREKLDEYNSELKNCVNEQIENFQSVLNIHANDFLNDLLNLSNNYVTILRVLSFIFRFVENLKDINGIAGPLTTKDFEKAETFLVKKKVQEQEFSSDINHLKTVHIELVSDLTSQAFIAALKRFMARRGKCAKLFSDNGKNFVGASNEIKKLLEIVRNQDEKIS
ncbi:integrase catalytic domain-containing protein [Trichonephila clavipes]|uniref:Integrase catalytic domain-containing protein n=1 Tax=Trichonephila clavipes TaxID=2585209 RepID=A0A8X6SEE3_TRICX|nr:integrase catalytic domain-containing protein [Trichonephila clavipes]